MILKNILYTPLGIWLLFCFFSQTIGKVILATTFSYAFMGGESIWGFLTRVSNGCGELQSGF